MNESFIKLNNFLKLFLFRQKTQKLGREFLKSYNRTDKGLLSWLWKAYLQTSKDTHTVLNTDSEVGKEPKLLLKEQQVLNVHLEKNKLTNMK